MVCFIDGSLEYFLEGGAHVTVGVQEVLSCLTFPFFSFLVGVSDGGRRNNKNNSLRRWILASSCLVQRIGRLSHHVADVPFIWIVWVIYIA